LEQILPPVLEIQLHGLDNLHCILLTCQELPLQVAVLKLQITFALLHNVGVSLDQVVMKVKVEEEEEEINSLLCTSGYM
jgi:hypothetical protein